MPLFVRVSLESNNGFLIGLSKSKGFILVLLSIKSDAASKGVFGTV